MVVIGSILGLACGFSLFYGVMYPLGVLLRLLLASLFWVCCGRLPPGAAHWLAPAASVMGPATAVGTAHTAGGSPSAVLLGLGAGRAGRAGGATSGGTSVAASHAAAYAAQQPEHDFESGSLGDVAPGVTRSPVVAGSYNSRGTAAGLSTRPQPQQPQLYALSPATATLVTAFATAGSALGALAGSSHSSGSSSADERAATDAGEVAIVGLDTAASGIDSTVIASARSGGNASSSSSRVVALTARSASLRRLNSSGLLLESSNGSSSNSARLGRYSNGSSSSTSGHSSRNSSSRPLSSSSQSVLLVEAQAQVAQAQAQVQALVRRQQADQQTQHGHQRDRIQQNQNQIQNQQLWDPWDLIERALPTITSTVL